MPYPSFGGTMILGPGRWSVNHWRGDAAFDNGLEMTSPFSHVITTVAAPYPGVTYTLPPIDDGDELILKLMGNIGTDRNSTNAFARFSERSVDGLEWFIDWEDWKTDEPTGVTDWNDSHTHIYRTPNVALNFNFKLGDGTGVTGTSPPSFIDLSRVRFKVRHDE